MSRPGFAETWFNVAAIVSERGTCPRLKVGAVLVGADGRVKSTGYNGAPSGRAHCTEAGCLTEPETGRCKRTVHAEINALLGASPEERARGTLYVTHQPCPECQAVLLNSGLATVYYREPYRAPLEDESTDPAYDTGTPILWWRS